MDSTHPTNRCPGPRWASRRAKALRRLLAWLFLTAAPAAAAPGGSGGAHTSGTETNTAPASAEPAGPSPGWSRAPLAVEAAPWALRAATDEQVAAELAALDDGAGGIAAPALPDHVQARINSARAGALPLDLVEVLAQLALAWGVPRGDGEGIDVPVADKGDQQRRWAQAAIDKNRAQLLRDSCATFMRFGLGMAVGPHHLHWSNQLMHHSKVSVLAARGHGKSAFWSYAYPLWRCWRAESTTGLLVSNTDDQTQRFFRIIKEGKRFTDKDGVLWDMPAASTVPLLQPILPDNWEKAWTGHRIFFSNGSSFAGGTFGKRFRGAHVDWIVVDDPIDDAAQFSKRIREKAYAFYTRAVSPMIQPSVFGQLACIGTPLHEDDLHARLAANPEYFHRKYPGMYRRPDGREVPLWPELRSEAWHRSKRLELGELAYNQEILLRPVSNETSLFPPELFSRRPETLQRSLRLGQWTQADIRALGLSVFMGVDVAISAEVGADYLVIVVAGVDANKNRYLIDLVRMHRQPFEAQLAEIHRVAVRYGISLGYIEANQLQVLYAAHFARHTDLPIRPFVTGTNKNDLVQGVLGLRPLFENGKWRFPQGDEHSITQVGILLAEFRDFSIVDDKLQGMGNHDDCVMALWICEQACRSGLAFGWGGLGEDAEDTTAAQDLSAWLAQVPHHLPQNLRQAWAEQLAAQAAANGQRAPDLASIDVDAVAEPAQPLYDDDRPVVPQPLPAMPGPRVNASAHRFPSASALHPEGEAGARRLAATLPAAREALIAAFNTISSHRPNLAQLTAECYAIAVEHGEEMLRAILGDIFGLAP